MRRTRRRGGADGRWRGNDDGRRDRCWRDGPRPGEQFLHTRDDHIRFERFGQDAVAANLGRLRLIDRFERAGQQQHRDMRQPRRRPDVLGHLVARAAGHRHVGQHNVRRLLVDGGDGLVAVTDRHDLDVFVRERQLDDALDGDAVVGEQKLVCHRSLLSALDGLEFTGCQAPGLACSGSSARTCSRMNSTISCIDVPG